jgi:DNA polymerase-3 subunit delta'
MAKARSAPEPEDIPRPDQVEGAPHPSAAGRLFGQKTAEDAFLNAWAAGRLHHAWLLSGPRGVGKATAAYRMARALLIHGDAAPDTLDCDPDHLVSRRIAARSEPRLRTITRPWDREKKRLRTEITVDVVRELKDFLHLSAADGGWRAAIVDAADEMNVSAANALLKILEEPPAKVALFLIAHAPGRLLPTIRSRCRVLDFRPLEPPDLAQALDATGVEARLGAAAALAGGSPGEALRIAAADGAAAYGRLARLLGGAPGIDRKLLLDVAESCGGRDAAPRFEATLRLSELLLQRLARAGAGAAQPEAVVGETHLAVRLCPGAAAARLWAEAAATVAAKGRRALSVNLDPVQTILDIWLEIDEVAARASGR